MEDDLIKALIFTGMMATAFGAGALEYNAGDTRFVDHEESPYSRLCVAAMQSEDALRQTARSLRMNQREVRRVTCNGMPIEQFAENGGVNANNAPAIVTVQ